MKTNRTLALSVLAGVVKPYLVGTMALNSALCRSILVSIANPRVFHSALHTGSDTGKDYGLHTFPRVILRQLEANTDAKWLVPFSLPPVGGTTNTTTGVIPKNCSIRFGAHRDSIYNTSQVTRSDPLAPTAPALTRQAHAGTLTQYHPSPLIVEETLPDYQTTLDSLLEEPDESHSQPSHDASFKRIKWMWRRPRTPRSSPRPPISH